MSNVLYGLQKEMQKLTFEEFEKKLEEFIKSIKLCDSYNEDVCIESKYLIYKGLRDGASGGSCWGTETTPFYNQIDETIFTNAIYKFIVNLTNVKDFNIDFESSFETYGGDFYGNFSNYVLLKIKIEDLYNIYKRNLNIIFE